MNRDDVELMYKYIDKSIKEIIRILMKEYNMTRQKAIESEKTVRNTVRAQLLEKYRFSDPLKKAYAELDKKNEEIYLERDYSDFSNWLYTAMIVPFYQSLGDTIGYKNGEWEFNWGENNLGADSVNRFIYEFIDLGGVNDMSITHWRASDDTILYMATINVLSSKFTDIDDFGTKLRVAYIDALPAMENRHPGKLTGKSLEIQKNIEWNKLPYSSSDIGNGSTMRAGCIGIFFPGSHNRKTLIALAVECSRITHNSAIAILGSVTAALFTAYALEKVPIKHWPHKLLNLLKSKKIDEYMEKSRPHEYHLFARDKVLFTGQWEKYISISFSGLKPKLLDSMKNPVQRFKYLADNFSKRNPNFVGGLADDSVIFAYDSLLISGNVIEKLIVYAILHPGDSDTVGSIAMSWFGAYYQTSKNLSLLNSRFEELEFAGELYNIVEKNIRRMIEVYYYDIYMHNAMKYIRNSYK